MEWWFICLIVVVVLTILNISRMTSIIQSKLTRLDRKLNFVLKQMNISFEDSLELSERVKEAARDPKRKIEAIKYYREETGASLFDCKEAVELYIESLRK